MVLWVLYAVAILLYPFYWAEGENEKALERFKVVYGRCLDAHSGYWDYCWERRDTLFKETGGRTTYTDAWSRAGMRVVWMFPVALVVPPLIVYGMANAVVRLVLKTSRWVAEGFREPQS